MKPLLHLIPALAIAACAPLGSEPPNLSDLKTRITTYAEDGTYLRDLESAVAGAKPYLGHRAASGEKNLTVIFDIDETVLSNLPHMKTADWGYQPPQWDMWVGEADAPALTPIREIYHTASALGYKVVFLTGRTELSRAATHRNLRNEGMGRYDRLILRPAPRKNTPSESAVDFKSRARKQLTEEGYTIVANFGDQQSDLQGGYSERTYKLPNPFYKIP
ncbi:acid phosphatase [Akkermansiaceae bacterium]|nr:acid phosphatase [Akkermansiaceae bacterium]